MVGNGLAEEIESRTPRKPLRAPSEHGREGLWTKRKRLGDSLGVILEPGILGHEALRFVQVGSKDFRNYHPPLERPGQGSKRLPYLTASDSKSWAMCSGVIVCRAQVRRPPRNAGNPIPYVSAKSTCQAFSTISVSYTH